MPYYNQKSGRILANFFSPNATALLVFYWVIVNLLIQALAILRVLANFSHQSQNDI